MRKLRKVLSFALCLVLALSLTATALAEDVLFWHTLEEMYRFEEMLQHHHPDNHNIRPKIRQQLQLLRDRGFVEFLGNGSYRRLA